MVLDEKRVAEAYDQHALDSIISALKTLETLKFFDFLVAENNNFIVESFNDDDETTLAKKIADNRNENRTILGLQAAIPNLERQLKNAQES